MTPNPKWVGIVRKKYEKKQMKAMLKRYGLSLDNCYHACEHYAKEVMKYNAPQITNVFANEDDYLGRREVNKVYWGMVVFEHVLLGAIRQYYFLDTLIMMHQFYCNTLAEGRINEYGLAIRHQAMMRYVGAEAESNLLTEKQCLELAKLFVAYLMKGFTVNDFVLEQAELRIELEDLNDRPDEYYALYRWYMENLYTIRYAVDDKFVKLMINVIHVCEAEERRTAVFYLTFYLIGLTNFDNVPQFIAGEAYQEWVDWACDLLEIPKIETDV